MSDIVVREPDSLVIHGSQSGWSDSQAAALRHIGVEGASEGDLRVFFHVCQRSGLDPFAKQIYMISRKTKDGVKQTIQTGIDGFRLIGHRAASAAGEKVSVSAPEWMHSDGGWREVWSPEWGTPLAARITITRAGSPFTAVALYSEYVQTKYGGDPNQMWATRPAGQLAKCAEALAWRQAFPQDLAGVYSDDEMGQADSAPRVRGRLAQRLSRESVETGEVLDTSSALAKAMFAALGSAGYADRDGKLAACSGIVGREVGSSSELTVAEARSIIDTLSAVEDES